ncbi:MAG: hypothetical protein WC791_00585 [Candidatus Paceibacterota bacterium]
MKIARDDVFVPHLVYYEDLGMLQAIFLDRAVDVEIFHPRFEALVDSNPTSKYRPLVGFNLYGVLDVLHEAGCAHQKSITLSKFVQLFDDIVGVGEMGVYGDCGDEVFELVLSHNLVWKIPKW